MDSEMWDARYEAADLVWSAEPNLFLPPLVRNLTPGRALDLACGEGRNAIWLAQQGWSVTGVDFSPVAIDKARKITRDASVDWVVGDATTYSSGQPFDLVIILYLHLPQPQLAAAFATATEMLAPGGTLFAVGHAIRNLTEGYGGPPYQEILWSVDAVADMLSGLDVVELDERLRPVEDADVPAIDIVAHATAP